jgi:hypothetical protein
VNQRRLPFSERLYDITCGSDINAPEGQSDDDMCSNDFRSICSDNEHFHADENDMNMDPVGVITQYVEETLQQAKNVFEDSLLVMCNNTLSQLATQVCDS